MHPGNLLEWETHWRRGLKARREVMEGVGAWFVQVGDLNTSKIGRCYRVANSVSLWEARQCSSGREGRCGAPAAWKLVKRWIIDPRSTVF